MPTPNIDTDTHDPAVQASAARLLAVLRKAYPEIHHFDHSSPSNIVMRAQGSLLGYLDAVINNKPNDESEYESAKNNKSIQSTIELIDYIRALSEEKLNAPDKKAIFEQMLVFAATHPGSRRWDIQQAHWSTNAYYNESAKRIEQSMTSPAEALNLVCRALFDEERYLINDGENEDTNLALHVETVCQYFLGERKDVESGQLQKCATGLQHDILYLLNGSFLDSPRKQGGKPIRLLMNKNAFLKESVSSFVSEQLKHHAGENAYQVLMAWHQWQQVDSDDECPLILWLRRTFPVDKSDAENIDMAWQKACGDYVKCRGLEAWLKIEDNDVGLLLKHISELEIPASDKTDCYLAVIMHMQPLQESSCDSDLNVNELVRLRNQVLDALKQRVRKHDKGKLEAISTLLSLFNSVDSLYRYRDLSQVLGESDGKFLSARQALQSFLQGCFSQIKNIDIVNIDENFFEILRKKYREQEHCFLVQNHVDFIENFFANLNYQQDIFEARRKFAPAFKRFMGLKGDGPTHPLIFSDTELFHLSNSAVHEGSTAVLDVTPYCVNRLFLHGLTVPIKDWSDTYCHTLILVAGWLSSAAQRGDGLLNNFKRSYPPAFLFNLKLMALLPREARNRLTGFGAVDASFVFGIKLRQSSLNNLDTIIFEHWQLYIGPSISALIQDGAQLIALLACSTQRTQVWDAAAGKLGELIQNSYQLIALLACNTLNNEQRTQVWDAVEERLGELIQDADQLRRLLACKTLSEYQRTQVWAAAAGELGELIRDASELQDLLECNTLSEDQRTQVLTAVKRRLGDLIQNSYQLQDLLNCEKLNADHCSQIRAAVPGLLEFSKNIRTNSATSFFAVDSSQKRKNTEDNPAAKKQRTDDDIPIFNWV